MDNTKIIVGRKKHLLACLRKFGVIVDEQKVADLANGKEVIIPVSDGHHIMHVKLGRFFISKPIEFDTPGEIAKSFECGIAPGFAWFMLRAIIMGILLYCYVFFLNVLSFEIRVGVVVVYCSLTLLWNLRIYKKKAFYDLYLIEKK